MTDTLVRDRPAPETVRALNCPNCGGTIALRAAGSSVSLVCEHCGSTLDTTRPDLAVIARAAGAMRRPLIPLGTRGTLAGVVWEAVGYLERSDGEVLWSEYLLFNPYEGYAFLVDDGRRFSLGTLMTAPPTYGSSGLRHDGRDFRAFGSTYPVRVQFVVGEFYWRVRVGERIDATDYVTSGTMLSCEQNGAERTWTVLDLLAWGVAERAFAIEPRARSTAGTPAPHEPSPHRAAMRDALIVAALALAACLVIAIGTAGSSRVLQRELSVPLDGVTHTTVVGPVTVTGLREKVRIAGSASGLDNMWVDLDYSLVNRATQESFDAYGVAERYHGSDADGAWSEGSSRPTTQLASIPRGSYDLVVESQAHRWTDPQARADFTTFAGPEDTNGATALPVQVTVTRGGGFAGPLFLALLAIGIWPLIAFLRHHAWEARRLAPVTTSDDDEEDDDR